MNRPASPAGGVFPPAPAEAVPSHRTGVLRVLADAAQPLTTAEVAAELGIHKNTVRFHLESLIATGQVEEVGPVRSRPGRPARAFRAVRRMDPTGPRHYELLAGVLTDALQTDPSGAARAIRAGQDWGARAAPSFGTPFAESEADLDSDNRRSGAAAHSATRSRPDDPVRESRTRLVALLDRFGFGPDHGAIDHDPTGATSAASGNTAMGPAPPITVRQCPFLELATDHQRIVCGVHLGLMRGALAYWHAPLEAEAVLPFVEPDRCLVQLSGLVRS